MKVDRQQLVKAIESVIYHGVTDGEEIDLTTNNIMKVVEPLILAVESCNSTNELSIISDTNKQLNKALKKIKEVVSYVRIPSEKKLISINKIAKQALNNTKQK